MTALQQRALGESVAQLQCAMVGDDIRALVAACNGAATPEQVASILRIPAVIELASLMSGSSGGQS